MQADHQAKYMVHSTQMLVVLFRKFLIQVNQYLGKLKHTKSLNLTAKSGISLRLAPLFSVK